MPGRATDLLLGRHRFDVTSRAVVVAVVAAPAAGEAVAAGADALEVVGDDAGAVEAIHAVVVAHDVPVLVATGRADVARAALDAGAVGCDVRGRPDEGARASCEDRGAALVVDGDDESPAHAFVAAGLDDLRGGGAPDGARCVFDATASTAPAAELTLAIALGARVLVVNDARTGRRTADVVAALLDARRGAA